MPLPPDFPTDPYAPLDPDHRWYPGDQVSSEAERAALIPPLVDSVRRGVKAWREAGYQGACPTTRALLHHWFETEHYLPNAMGAVSRFRWYFAQREAVESTIWLYEVANARTPHALMAYDSSQSVSRRMFLEDWTRYVLKLATGAGKTKVMSLLMVWSYFHKRYEAGSPLSANILLIAPNIIVLDRLRADFDGGRIFFQDPLLPPNGYVGRNWQDDFQLTVHIQDEVGRISPTGNLFLTNIHRVFTGDVTPPSFEDEDTTDYFLGPRPVTSSTERMVDLGLILREIDDLLVLNDEAHHIHERNAWFEAIEEIALKLRQKGRALSAQIDLSATPKHNTGAIFVQTVCDYPLVEAIRQGVVKRPVLPDGESRTKLKEHQSIKFTERYEDFLHLGYLEWKASYDELSAAGRKPVLFVMTEDTKTSDEVAAFLEARYPELSRAVLVIHTKNNGEISERGGAKEKSELERLRKESREIDNWDNPHKAVVSVMVLREGWDVRNVTVIVGLRAYTSTAKILPEQTLGRGLRRMFFGQDLVEQVSVIGTPAFMEFVESIRSEGVEFDEVSMGSGTPGQGPLVIEVDSANPHKDIAALDIDIPVLARRFAREYKQLELLDPFADPRPRLPLRAFGSAEQRDIVFKRMDDDTVSHVQYLDQGFTPSAQNVIGFFTRELLREARLVGGFDVLYGKLKAFMADCLFAEPVDLDDLNTLRNLAEPQVTRAIYERFRRQINDLIVVDTGATELEGLIRLSSVRPSVVERRSEYRPRKSVFNRVVGEGRLELEFASYLDTCPDIISFAKNSRHIGFRVEYRDKDGFIRDYFPDFIVRRSKKEIWIVETKGREEVNDSLKRARLEVWVAEASSAIPDSVSYQALYIRQYEFEKHRNRLATFDDAIKLFA
jgi:type III restriction enzyme